MKAINHELGTVLFQVIQPEDNPSYEILHESKSLKSARVFRKGYAKKKHRRTGEFAINMIVRIPGGWQSFEI